MATQEDQATSVETKDQVYVYVYWDQSNIFIEAQRMADKLDRNFGDDVAYRIHIDFRKLLHLARENRLVAKAVTAGSVPPEMKEVWENLRSSGVRTEIIDWKETGNAERELPDRKLLHLARENRLVAKAVTAGSVPPEMKEVWENLRSSGVRTEIIDWKETGNAERELPDLHLQREMLMDGMLNKPGTAVLLTGDGAGWAYNKGFLPVLKAMKQRGWQIELLSWSHSCNTRLRQWVVQNGHFTNLDTFYPSITFLKPSDNRQEWGGRPSSSVELWRKRAGPFDRPPREQDQD